MAPCCSMREKPITGAMLCYIFCPSAVAASLAAAIVPLRGADGANRPRGRDRRRRQGAGRGSGRPAGQLTYANRPMCSSELRSWRRPPSVVACATSLDRLVEAGITGPVEPRRRGVDGDCGRWPRHLFAIVPSDADSLAGERRSPRRPPSQHPGCRRAERSGRAQPPRQMLMAVLQVLFATAIFVALMWLLRESAYRRQQADG